METGGGERREPEVGEGLAGLGGGVVVPADGLGPAGGAGVGGEGAGVRLARAAAPHEPVVVAVVVLRAHVPDAAVRADVEVPVGVLVRAPLDALWLRSNQDSIQLRLRKKERHWRRTAGIAAVVLAGDEGLEVVVVALTAGVDEALALARDGVVPVAVHEAPTGADLLGLGAHRLCQRGRVDMEAGSKEKEARTGAGAADGVGAGVGGGAAGAGGAAQVVPIAVLDRRSPLTQDYN